MADPADADRARASASRLAGRGYAGHEGFVRALQDDGHEGVRAEAAFLLGFGGDSEAAGALEAALADETARVRVEAAVALGRLGEREPAVHVLHEELEGAFFAAAPIRAARGLALLGDPAGWPRVLAALRSEQPAERMEGVAAVPSYFALAGANVDDVTVDPATALEQAARDPEPIVAGDARAALERLPGA